MDENNENTVKIQIDTADLDSALEKANRLKELLQEVHELISSLGSISRKYD